MMFFDVVVKEGIEICEECFMVEDMLNVCEVFIIVVISICFFVVFIDGKMIGNGYLGFVLKQIREVFFDIVEKIFI